jgi:hypothetical protein
MREVGLPAVFTPSPVVEPLTYLPMDILTAVFPVPVTSPRDAPRRGIVVPCEIVSARREPQVNCCPSDHYCKHGWGVVSNGSS